MKLSARNQIPATVTGITAGEATANVELDAGGVRLVASITVEAARDIAVATASQWLTIFGGGMPPRLLNPDVWPLYCERFEDIFGMRPSASTAFDKEGHTG